MLSSRFFVNKSTFARSTIGVSLYQMIHEQVSMEKSLFANQQGCGLILYILQNKEMTIW